MDPVTISLIVGVCVSGIINILQALKHTFKKCGSIEFKETPPQSQHNSERGQDLNIAITPNVTPNNQEFLWEKIQPYNKEIITEIKITQI